MRRPMPPELIALGDQLEAAAARAVRRRRRARRQLWMNGAASVLVALPLAVAIGKDYSRPVIQTTATPLVSAPDLDWPLRAARDDRARMLQRISGENLRHRGAASPVLLELPSILRPALR
jgi:hypothetical protein